MEIIAPPSVTAPITTANPDIVASVEERLHQLPIDKIVRASVQEGGQERVLLDVNGQRIVADTRVPLKTGQKLNLLVIATSPKLELQIVADPLRARLGQTIHLTGDKIDILSLLQPLIDGKNPVLARLSAPSQEVLNNLINKLNQNPLDFRDGNFLKNLAQLLGLNLEQRLALEERMTGNLKSALLELVQLLGDDDTELAGKAKKLLQQLELFQFTQLRLNQQNTQVVPLPLPFLENGYLITEQEHQAKEGAEKKPLLVTLHMSLLGLGDLQVDLLYDKKELYVRFLCDSQDKADFAAGFKDELSEAITSVPVQGMTFGSGAENPGKILISRIMGEEDSILDMRV